MTGTHESLRRAVMELNRKAKGTYFVFRTPGGYTLYQFRGKGKKKNVTIVGPPSELFRKISSMIRFIEAEKGARKYPKEQKTFNELGVITSR